MSFTVLANTVQGFLAVIGFIIMIAYIAILVKLFRDKE